MTELEIEMIPSLGNYLQNWKRFVDDTFEFALPDKIEYIVNQLNTFDKQHSSKVKWRKKYKGNNYQPSICWAERRTTNVKNNSLEDGVKPKVVYNSAKLSQYFNVKDPVPQKYKSDLVYKCTCPQIDCNESYVGETERRFEERIIDHDKRDKKSHIYKHSSENSYPHVWLDNFEIVGRNYGNRIKRKIGEALSINELKPSLNKQDKSFPVNLFNSYNFFNVTF